jgi:pseudouridine-5'-phosphate glycosidase
MDNPHDIAKAHVLRGQLGLPGGQLIGNPIPAKDEIARASLQPIIAQAMQEAEDQSITGKAVTPFLLQRIFELTNGQSLTANIALVRNNAQVAARIASELITIETKTRETKA